MSGTISRKFFKKSPDVSGYINTLQPVDYFFEGIDKLPDGINDILDKAHQVVEDAFPSIEKGCKKFFPCIDLSRFKIKYKIDIDLRHKCPRIYDQGNIGSCTANAGCLLYTAATATNGIDFDPSRLFLYYTERLRCGNIDKDTGAPVVMAVNCLRYSGVAPESLWPYDTKKVLDIPSKSAFEEAKKHKIKGSEQVFQNRDLLIKCLLDGKPFIFGFNLGRNFRDKVGRTGIYDREHGDFIGSHAVCCVGYCKEKRSFLVANSWGTGWGLNGYFLFHEDMMLKTSVVTTFYTYSS